jgi:predicted RNA-binding protein
MDTSQLTIAKEQVMCNESAFVLYYPGGHRHLEDVDLIEFKEGKLQLRDMKGNESFIDGHVRLIDLVNRRIEVVE